MTFHFILKFEMEYVLCYTYKLTTGDNYKSATLKIIIYSVTATVWNICSNFCNNVLISATHEIAYKE